MKKIILTITILIILISMCCYADTITTQQNTNESSAAKLDFDDTAVIYGELYGGTLTRKSKFYKFTVPYNGTLTVKARATVPETTFRQTYYSVIIYNSTFESDEMDLFLKTNKSTNSSDSFDISLPKGTYFFDISGDWVFGSENAEPPSKDTTLYLTFDFECSHIETEEVTVKEATCKEKGKIEERCTECEEVLSTDTIDKLPHTPAEEWVITKEVSCEADGEKVLYCTVCEDKAEVEVIEALPHTYGDWTVDKETSCEKPGERSRVCEDCSYKDVEEIEQLDHKFGKWNVEVEATCSEKGKRSRICSVCEYEDQEAVDTLDHKFGSWKTLEAATCTKEGERERTCKDCNYVETEEIEMKDHKFGSWKTITQATESRDGKRTRTCSVCDKTETETVDRLECGDEYEWQTTTAATCTSNGTKKKICSYCGKTLSTQTIQASGHEYSDWEVTRVPTKERDGVESRECENCGKTETRSVKLTHGDYGEWQITKAATCKEAGVKSFICDCCGKATDTENIPKSEHKYTEWNNSRHASPERKGLKSRACSICGDTQTEEPEYDFEALKKQAEGNAPFTDVMDADWFKPVVGKCYHYKLMVGDSASTFNPNGNITIAEVITSAVRIYCLMNPDESKPVITADPWYQGYVDYAIEKGIIKADDFTNYDTPATRAEMAYIFVNAATSENLEAINNFEHLPDVPLEHKYANEIFALYNAGVLTGNDAQGTFYPENNIIRAEAAAIIARISGISERVKK